MPNEGKNETTENVEPGATDQNNPPGILASCCACLFCLCCTAICIPLSLVCCCCNVANSTIQRAQGKRWDSIQNQWVIDDLVKEEEALKEIPDDDGDILKLAEEAMEEDDEGGEGVTPPKSDTSGVKETAYYDTLGVAPGAPPDKIKRAYYIKARKWHPDRNDSDEAKEKFQQIGEAYQVLSDEKLRAIYDQEGESGLSGDRTEAAIPKVDPSLIFTFLFGSDAFNDIIGRLRLVTQTNVGDPSQSRITQTQVLELERRRVVRLAIKLKERIQKYVDGEEDSAKAEWKAEAERLVKVRYGEQILNLVGSAYKLVTKQCVGSWSEGAEARRDQQDIVLGAAIKAAKGASNMTEGDVDDQFPSYIEVLWNTTVIDISGTLHEVVMKVLSDKSIKDDVAKKRAEAITALGEIFEMEKCKTPTKDQQSVRSMYQDAAQAAMEKNLNRMKEEQNSMRPEE